jgi:hypothetical protein
MKFHHLSLVIINSAIVSVWRVMSNLNALTAGAGLAMRVREEAP